MRAEGAAGPVYKLSWRREVLVRPPGNPSCFLAAPGWRTLAECTFSQVPGQPKGCRFPNTGSEQPRIHPFLLRGPTALRTLPKPSSGVLAPASHRAWHFLYVLPHSPSSALRIIASVWWMGKLRLREVE